MDWIRLGLQYWDKMKWTRYCNPMLIFIISPLFPLFSMHLNIKSQKVQPYYPPGRHSGRQSGTFKPLDCTKMRDLASSQERSGYLSWSWNRTTSFVQPWAQDIDSTYWRSSYPWTREHSRQRGLVLWSASLYLNLFLFGLSCNLLT